MTAFFRGIARWWASLTRKNAPENPAVAWRTLTDEEIGRIAERALGLALQTELGAPEIKAWVEQSADPGPRRVRMHLHEYDD